MQKQLGELTIRNAQLIDQFDQAQVALAAAQKAADTASAKAAAAARGLQAARHALAATVTARYETGGFSAAGALLTSTNGQAYLTRLETLRMLSDHKAQLVAALGLRSEQASQADKQADELLAAAAAKRDELSDKRSHVTAQITKYSKLLHTLTVAQRRAFLASVNPKVSSSDTATAEAKLVHAGSASARIAVKYALAQVGKPYVFGADGPGSFDCSGLTMAAWDKAGVSLPHSAADQYNYGTHVPISKLQPGDLVFFYQPIGHVTIYLGNGLMVSAPESGENVSVVPLSAFDGQITGATRLS